MELDTKVRYVILALAAATAVLVGLGFHAGLHAGPLEGGGIADKIVKGFAR